MIACGFFSLFFLATMQQAVCCGRINLLAFMLFRLHQKEINTGYAVVYCRTGVETTTNSLYCISVEALLTQINTSIRVSKLYNSTQ